MPHDPSLIAANLSAVEERIGRALDRCGRKRSELTVVAVTKKFSAGAIRAAYQAGLRDFGENYVQEFAGKKPAVADLEDARFHLIGHLQSNKAKLASELFEVVHTVDSPKLFSRLSGPELFIEVKLSGETSKTGAPESELGALIASGGERVSGLMTVPPWSDDPEASRPYFARLRELAGRYGLSKLSMGMSGDFEIAIEEGATIVRVGTALFGPRPKA